MNDQTKRRIKTKYNRGLTCPQIVIDIEAATGTRLTVADVLKVIGEPVAHAAPLTPAELRSEERRMRKARCLNLRKYGWQQQDIAEELGVSLRTVGRWLRERGATRPRRTYSDRTVQRVREGYRSGTPVRLMAANIGAPKRTIYRWLSDSPKADQS